ncbi:glutamate--cysteine ligase [Dermatophilus congolensis]|uniref:glutamate--cysteine ligase n=1 Tax=Dermatophilus congolensis TaxID=1863 RepID=UPI001AAF89BE
MSVSPPLEEALSRMGREITSPEWDFSLPGRFRSKVQLDLDVFEKLLSGTDFAAETPMTGVELELDLIDANGQAVFDNLAVIDATEGIDVVPELARFNVEVNAEPRLLDGDALHRLRAELRASMGEVNRAAATIGASVLPIGLLPTLTTEELAGEWMTESSRFQALNDAIIRARGEDVVLDITGPSHERLHMGWPTVAPEGACTSFQLHTQVTPRDFARAWNSAQAIAGAQVAIGANSPYFFGTEIWQEGRVPVFTQAVDTRPAELVNQGVNPRVHFGDNWITSIFDLLEANVRYFPPLLPEMSDEDPEAVLAAGGVPQLEELMLHNGTIYRWNRPIYDTAGGVPHLRVENRVLPAGPTAADMVANAAFFFGATRFFSRQTRPIWSKLSFTAAETNFLRGARDGFDAQMFWPGIGRVTPDQLVLDVLLPVAEAGLRGLGADQDAIDLYLGVIEGRCLSRTNGAVWQVQAVKAFESRGQSRAEALRSMTLQYQANARTGEPVHTWDIPHSGGVLPPMDSLADQGAEMPSSGGSSRRREGPVVAHAVPGPVKPE